MAAAAALYSVDLGHHEEPQIAIHLLASQPHGTYVEIFDRDRDPIWWNLIVNRPELEAGSFRLPSAPGLGWQLDEDNARQFRHLAEPAADRKLDQHEHRALGIVAQRLHEAAHLHRHLGWFMVSGLATVDFPPPRSFPNLVLATSTARITRTSR